MLFKLFHRIKFVSIIGLAYLLCLGPLHANAQYFDLNSNRKQVKLPFKLIRNLVIIQLNINDKGPFNFILDTGVGLMIITDPKLVDSIGLENKRTIRLPGLGEGLDYEAYVTSPLKINIPGMSSYDVAAAILKSDHFGLSNFAGIPIHGLLGYEFFNNLAIKLDFSDSTLTAYRPKDVRLFRKGIKLPISIEAHKPYLTTKVILPDGTAQQRKLVIDIGAGHPVSLENMIRKKGLPQKFIPANLGVGLTGPISGFISRISEIDIGKFKIKDVVTSFPNDYDETDTAKFMVKRDGNLGIGILKKFTVIFDYSNSLIYLKPNSTFREPFEHDMSGLEYYTAGTDLKRIIISRVEPGSAADDVGLEKDDEIVAINFKAVSEMTIEQIDQIFKSKNERSLYLEIYHDHKHDGIILTLKRRI